MRVNKTTTMLESISQLFDIDYQVAWILVQKIYLKQKEINQYIISKNSTKNSILRVWVSLEVFKSKEKA